MLALHARVMKLLLPEEPDGLIFSILGLYILCCCWSLLGQGLLSASFAEHPAEKHLEKKRGTKIWITAEVPITAGLPDRFRSLTVGSDAAGHSGSLCSLSEAAEITRREVREEDASWARTGLRLRSGHSPARVQHARSAERQQRGESSEEHRSVHPSQSAERDLSWPHPSHEG